MLFWLWCFSMGDNVMPQLACSFEWSTFQWFRLLCDTSMGKLGKSKQPLSLHTCAIANEFVFGKMVALACLLTSQKSLWLFSFIHASMLCVGKASTDFRFVFSRWLWTPSWTCSILIKQVRWSSDIISVFAMPRKAQTSSPLALSARAAQLLLLLGGPVILHPGGISGALCCCWSQLHPG